MLAQAGGSSAWVAIVAVVVGFALTLLAGLCAYIFKNFVDDFRATTEQLRSAIREAESELKDLIKENRRHLEGMMTTTWDLAWRLDAIEEHLAGNGYRPRPVPRRRRLTRQDPDD